MIASQDFLLFVKRKAPFVHYSNEWKKSRSLVTAVHSLNPDMEGLGIRGKAWAIQIAGTSGESVPAIFGSLRDDKYRLISLSVSLNITTIPLVTPVEFDPVERL